MSLTKVTSDGGTRVARFPAAHAAAQQLGTPLPNSPDGYKDYPWAAVHILAVAVVAGSNAFACGPTLGKSDMHAAVVDKVLLHWVENTQIRGEANTPIEHAHAITAFLRSAPEARPNFVNPPTFPRARASANHWDSPRSSRVSSLIASLSLTRLSLQWESRPHARSRLVVDEKENTRKSQWAPHRVRSSDGASPVSPPQKLGRPRVSSR